MVAAIRKALPTVEIEIRADSGFATPQLYDFCEQEGLQYVIGLSRNPRLEGTVEPVLEQTRRQFEENEEKQREFGEFHYQAKTWKYSGEWWPRWKSTKSGSTAVSWSPIGPTCGPLYDH